MTPFSLSEKDPALGLHELDHVSVLLRLRHNYILGPPRLQDQAQSGLLVKLRVNGACLLAQGDDFLQDRRVRARRLRPGGDQGSFAFYEQIHDLILTSTFWRGTASRYACDQRHDLWGRAICGP